MCLMFVQIPKKELNVMQYAETLGFEKIALYSKGEQIKGKKIPGNFRDYTDSLVDLVSTPRDDSCRTKEMFVKKFIVYYADGPLQALRIITSKKELREVLDYESSLQRAPTLMLATAEQLMTHSSPLSISDFLAEREAHKKALAKKEETLKELRKQMILGSANSSSNVAENNIVKQFMACVC